MHTTEEQQRVENIYESAGREKRHAIEAQLFYKFFYAHRADGINFQANENILRNFLIEQGLPISLENLELAYLAEGAKICSRTEEYVRQTDTQQSRFVEQRRVPNPINETVLPLTAQEIRQMPPDKLKKLMQHPEKLRELNRILGIKIK